MNVSMMSAVVLAFSNPVSLFVASPEESLAPGEESVLQLTLSVEKPWYIYAPTGVNIGQGMVETEVKLNDNDTVQFRDAAFPEAIPYHSFDVLMGDVEIVQPLRVRPDAAPGETTVRGALTFQVCNYEICLPPDQIGFSAELTVAR